MHRNRRVPPVLPVTSAPPGEWFCPGCQQASQHEPDKDEPNEYEALCLGNITNNEALLATLGIASTASAMRESPESKPRQTPNRWHSHEGPSAGQCVERPPTVATGGQCRQPHPYPALAYRSSHPCGKKKKFLSFWTGCVVEWLAPSGGLVGVGSLKRGYHAH